MRKALFLSAIIFTVAFSGVSVNGQASMSRVMAEANRRSGDSFSISMRTPRGAAVYAVNRPSAAALNAIDRGLTDLFAVARKHGYYGKTRHSDYTIFIAKADRTTNSAGEHSPDFAIPTAHYAGTIYDQGGFMYVAGLIIANNPCAFMVAEHTRDLDRMANVVRYEGEHLILYHNDRRRFQATADHSRGGSHPILQ
jgi:hypothetical protein